MATYSKEFLSGGTGDGRGIKVAETATAGTLIHTADTTAMDEIHLWAWNSKSSDVLLTIEWGGVTDPDDIVEFTVPTIDGWYPIKPGFILTGEDVVGAFAVGNANVIVIQGFVNRIT
jgi:hypothetical protein